MTTTEQAMAELLDRDAIQAVTVAYCWALDNHRFEDLRNVFLPDATASLLEERVGIDSIIERISGALGAMDDSQHLVSNHEIVLDGDRATCRCYLQAQHVRHAAAGGPNFIIAGRYEDEFERTPAGWRIRRRVLTPMWREGNPEVARRPSTEA